MRKKSTNGKPALRNDISKSFQAVAKNKVETILLLREIYTTATLKSRETLLDRQLEAGDQAGEDEVVLRISASSSREDRSGKQLEFDKDLFLSDRSPNIIAIIKVLEGVATNTNYIIKVFHGALFRTTCY